jgi:hypothetical protein
MARSFERAVFQLHNFNLQNFNMMDQAVDHDYLVLFTCLLFPFGDGQVVSDVTATIAILSSVLTMYRFTVVLCQGQVVAVTPTRQQSQDHLMMTLYLVIIKNRAWQPLQ